MSVKYTSVVMTLGILTQCEIARTKSMQILLYNNSSPRNKITKALTQVGTLAGSLRDETNIVSPTIRISGAVLPDFNYAQIPNFNRYYYLRDARSVRSGIWDISLQSDPLMSFNLAAVKGVVTEAQELGSNYLNGRQFVRLVKSKTDIITFPNGLLDSGEYILITAGG